MGILNKIKHKEEEQVMSQKKDDSKKINSRSALFLIKQAWITEKSGSLAPQRKYIFKVNNKANKTEVKKAIESIYGVNIQSVNVINIKGKEKRLGKSIGKTSNYKKAIITLKEGQKIDIMPA